MTSPPSIRSNMSSRRPTMTVARKSTMNPSVSIIFADTEQSSPPRGSATAGLEPKIIAHDKEIRKRDREETMATAGSGEVRDGSGDTLSVKGDALSQDGLPTRSRRARTNSLMSLLSFRRSPSKQSLRVPEQRPTRSEPPIGTTSGTNVDDSHAEAVPLSESPKESMHLDIEGLPGTSNASSAVSALAPNSSVPKAPDSSNDDTKSARSVRSASRGWFGSLSRKSHSVPDDKSEASAVVDIPQATPTISLDESGSSSQRHATDARVPSTYMTSGSETSATSDAATPRVIGLPQSSRSIWFAPQRDPPQPSAPLLERVPSGPSSLDVKTPTQQDHPSILEERDSGKSMPEMEVISSRSGDKARLSDLNPSTSRFMLSMPLLGRPKVPLEEVIAKSGVNATASGSLGKDKDKVSSMETENAASGTSKENVESTTDSTTPKATALTLNTRNDNAEARTLQSSINWWSYVGFGGPEQASSVDKLNLEQVYATANTSSEDSQMLNTNTTTSSAMSPHPPEPEFKIEDHPLSSLPESRTQSNPAATTAEFECAEDSAVISDVSKAQPAVLSLSDQGAANESHLAIPDGEARGVEKPMSLTSSQSAWQTYSPWALYDWYAAPVSTSSNATAELSTEAPVAEAGEGDEQNPPKPMTEAEKVKHEALARPDVPLPATPKRNTADKDLATSSSHGAAPGREAGTDDTLESNDPPRAHASSDAISQNAEADTATPLQERALASSLVVNAKGWVSFFSSSRSLSIATTRGLTEKSEADKSKEDGDGMEVMVIDEPQEARKAKSAPPSIPLSPALKPISRASSKAPSISVSGPSSPRKDCEFEANESSTSNGKLQEKSATNDGPLTNSQEPKQKAFIISTLYSSPQAASNTSNSKLNGKRDVSPSPSDSSKRSSKSAPPTPNPQPKPPNLILPTFDDIFKAAPRSSPPSGYVSRAEREREEVKGPGGISARSRIRRTLGLMSNVFFARDDNASRQSPASPPPSPQSGARRRSSSLLNPHSAAREERGSAHLREDLHQFGGELPKAWEVLGEDPSAMVGERYKRVVVIGVHGWFPGNAMRAVVGEPTGTSIKFANMMELAVKDFAEKHGLNFDEMTKIPLDGEGKIGVRSEKLYRNLTSNEEWMTALHAADVIFVATHSQGSIVSTHLIHRLLEDGHIRTGLHHGHLHQEQDGGGNAFSEAFANAQATISSGAGGVIGPKEVELDRREQRVCCLAMCGIHLGPLAYLQKNSFLMPYIQWFESEAAAELFEFQNTESRVSKAYISALRDVLDHGVKFVYIASMNDQVVPIYSGSFSAVSHPLIVRALYIDGDAYHSSDFLSNLLVLLMRIRNAGLPDGGLLAHLSEATAGSLNGVGHSTAYEEPATFSLAVDYLFLADNGMGGPHDLTFEPFNALDQLNDYEIPWSLRDLIADERVLTLFSKEFIELRDAFGDWHPRTTILRDLKRKLEPIKRLKLSSIPTSQTSKL